MVTPAAPSGTVVVLAGPGVLAADGLDNLRTLASTAHLGVANTWGAKGAFAWDSPHHLGTCGLQARDFELLGWSAVDTIIATGIDPDESPRERFALAAVLDVDPADLGSLATAAWDAPTAAPPINELYPRLAAVAQPGYVDDAVPLHPARAVADLGAVLPPGGLVTATPGIAGLWVARTFPTPALTPGAPRRVVVPATRTAGLAARLAIDAARAGRPAIVVTTAPVDTATTSECAIADDEDLDLVIVVWGAAGRLRSADDHRVRVAEALATPGVSTLEVPVALERTQLLVDAAGEVVAWGGLG